MHTIKLVEIETGRSGGATSNNSDPLSGKYANLDFPGGKSRTTMRVDNTTLAVFKARADVTGGNYQMLMNRSAAGRRARNANRSQRIRTTKRKGGVDAFYTSTELQW